MSSKEKNISRKEFLRKTACLALCPVFLSTLSSCGKTLDENESKDEINSENESEAGVRVESSVYENMNLRDTVALQLEGTTNGILLYKNGENSFLAFDATCPHAGGVVKNASSDELGVCSLHGATFKHTGVSDFGPAKGQSLVSYSVIVKSDHLLIQV